MTLPNASASTASTSSGVLILSGYGLRVAVERGHLVAEDGLGRDRRRQQLPRVGHGIRRIIVLGHSGTVSLEALRWMHELDIAFLQLGRDAELIAIGAPNALIDVRLRRAQALAMHSEAGLSIARNLLSEKVSGQAKVLDFFNGQGAIRQAMKDALGLIAEARSIEHLRFVESRAAAAYWSAWEEIPMQFVGRNAKHVPTHWRTFGTRRSLLTAGPRKATNPGNALLNYLYTILEAESRLAAIAVGCDPTLGIIHADKPGRDSLACDIMEPVRPKVDAYVLRLVATRAFERSDFFETREGNCRLMPELTRPLVTTAVQWGRAVAPIAERVGGSMMQLPLDVFAQVKTTRSSEAPLRFRTPLTGANRSRRSNKVSVAVASIPLPNRCHTCGASLGTRKRKYCDICLPDAVRHASEKGVDTQQQLQAIGEDRRSSQAAREKHRRDAAQQAKDRQRWEARQESVPSRATFAQEIAPLLQRVPSDVLGEATGLTRKFCNMIRRGAATPHPRHWDALYNAARVYLDAHSDEPGFANDPLFFEREIAPHLRSLGTTAIQRATGLSQSYARRVLAGHHVPHVRHWLALHRATRNETMLRAKK